MPTVNILAFNIYGSGDNVHVTNQDNDVYIAVDATGVASVNTGELTGAFYPRYSNPKGYITQTWLNGLASSGDILIASGSLQNQIDNLNVIPIETGNFVTNDVLDGVEANLNNQIDNLKSQTGVFLTNLNGTGVLTNAFYPLNGNPSGFVMSKSGVLIVDGFSANIKNGELLIGSAIDNSFIQGSLIGTNGISIVSGAGSLVVSFTGTTNVNTGSLVNAFYPLNSNPSNYATTTYVNNVSGVLASQLGGSGSQVKVTGSNVVAVPNIVGLGSTKVILSGSSVLISGNLSGATPPGNFAQVTSGLVTMVGGATISNGDLLIGNAPDNSFTQGKLNAGSGISITSGAASLTISCTVNQQPSSPVNIYDIKTKGSNYIVTNNDFTLIHTGNNPVTFTVPSPVSNSGRVWIFKNASPSNTTITASTGQIYVTGNTSSFNFNSGDAWSIHSDGIKYYAH